MPGQETVNPRTIQHTSQRRLSVNISPDAINLTPNGEPTLIYRPDSGLYWIVKHNGVIHNLKFQSGPIRDRKDYVDISLEIQKDLLVKNDVIVNRKVGIGNSDPGGVANGLSLSPDLEIRGGTGTGAAAAGVLTLSTAETTVVNADVLGAIVFQSPLEASGTDGVLSGAAIWAEADATFSASVNNTELVFATNTSAAATERMRIDASGNVGVGAADPGSLLEVRGPTGTGAAIAGVLTLSTSETSVRVGTVDQLGRIDFQAPKEGGGTDAILVGASIHAVVEEDFSSVNNSTALVFSTGTTTVPIERMRIDQDGFVGIGQSAPASENSASAFLHIGSSSDGIASLIIEDNGNKWEIMSNNNLLIKDGTTGRLRIAGADGEVHICHNGGNLGIGTSSPEAQVSITSGYHVIAIEQDIRYAHSGDNTAIVELSDVKIPAKAIITRVVAVLKVLSNLVTHEVNIQMSTASGVSADATDSFTELLGAGVTNTDSTDSTSASDISMGTSASDLKDVWICRDVVRNGTSDQYVYVCNAGTGNGTTNSSAGTLVVIIEYYGMD